MQLRTLCVVAASGLSLLGVSQSAFAQSNNPGGTAPADAPAPAAPAPAPQPAPGAPGAVDSSQTGGQVAGQANPALTPSVPGTVAQILPSGLAAAPTGAPIAVQQAIWATNRIIGLPYVYGGGHGAFKASGYDCSGTISYALHGASLLKTPLDSSEFMRWGQRGPGQWITIYSNAGHAFMTIAGVRLDTSAAGDPSGAKGPRWRPVLRSTRHFRVRHLPGL